MQSVCVMIESIVWSRTFHQKFEDKSDEIARFNQHIAQVKQTVSPERLLVYEVSMGWEALCQFLNHRDTWGNDFSQRKRPLEA